MKRAAENWNHSTIGLSIERHDPLTRSGLGHARAQLLLRWQRSVAQIEFSLSSALSDCEQVEIINFREERNYRLYKYT